MTMPLIKLQIEEMHHQVLHHLGQYHQDIESEVDKCLKQAIDSFDFESVIKAEAKRVLEREVKDAIARAISKIFWNAETEQKIAEAIKEIMLGNQE